MIWKRQRGGDDRILYLYEGTFIYSDRHSITIDMIELDIELDISFHENYPLQ